DKYRIIIDSNSAFMDESFIADIERFVWNGGVFVTNGQTGRHTPTRPDVWPISKLTGFEVVQVLGGGDGRSISPAPEQTVFTPREIPNRTRAEGLSLKDAVPECRPL